PPYILSELPNHPRLPAESAVDRRHRRLAAPAFPPEAIRDALHRLSVVPLPRLRRRVRHPLQRANLVLLHLRHPLLDHWLDQRPAGPQLRPAAVVDRHPATPGDRTVDHPRPARCLSARPPVRANRLGPVADHPDLPQSEAVQRPGSDLAQGCVLLRLYSSLLPLSVGLAPGCRHPDDPRRRVPLRVASRTPEPVASRSGHPSSFGA